MQELLNTPAAVDSRRTPAARPSLAQAAAVQRGAPFRLWMTSSLAVVTLSFFTARRPHVSDAEGPVRITRHSPHGVGDTLRRIELALGERGLALMTRFGAEHEPVMVLSSSLGGTPVLMSNGDLHPDLPLSVQIKASFFGGSDVLMVAPSAAPYTDWSDLPEAVVQDIMSLPEVVEAALS
jgi:hypothetical protein